MLHEKRHMLHDKQRIVEHKWKRAIKNEEHQKKDKPVHDKMSTVQLDDAIVKEPSYSIYGASAAAVVGLVLGGSYLYMNNRRNQKEGLQSSLIDSQE